jgi:hypothetical protein
MRVYMYKHVLLSLSLTCLISLGVLCQDNSSAIDRIISFPNRVFTRIDKESSRLERKIEKSTEKYLQRLERREQVLYRKLYTNDSTKAKEVFGNISERYARLRNTISEGAPDINTPYIGRLDSLSTTLRFLQGNTVLQQAGFATARLSKNLNQVTSLKQRLNAVDQLRNQVRERQTFLKEQFHNSPLAKEFREFRKDVYYFQQQITEYREALNDPEKLGARLLKASQKIPAFNEFFRKHSQLASMFRIPGEDDPLTAQSLYGLQTRVDIQALLQQRIGNDPASLQQLQGNIQEAQNHMQQLKNKLLQNASKGISGNEDLDFKPNNQKTKTLRERMEMSVNIQSQKPNGWFPVTSDFGLSLGYKLNDKSVIGIGASYKMGWGQSIRQISITHQGVGLRSFIDWKLKGSFWFSGGYEQNYQNAIKRISQLKQLSAWQQSGLIGLTKIVSVKTKFLKQTKLQLLWDFLSPNQTPRSQPIVFRVGYNLK